MIELDTKWLNLNKIGYETTKMGGNHWGTKLLETPHSNAIGLTIFEPRCEKTGFLHMRKQRGISVAQ